MHRPHVTPTRSMLTAVLAATTAVLVSAVVAAPAHAATSAGPGHRTTTRAASADDPFYDPPATLPAHDGDVVRSEPSVFYLDPFKALRAPADVQRIMYRSTDHDGTPIAVTGAVLTPTAAWRGAGPRPLVAYAVGTQGLGDQCAPSRQMAAGSEDEGVFIQGLLARGYGVAVTDYQGLGTPGVHTYMSRAVQGHAVLDVLRAAQRLPAAHLPVDGPVAITGYSQGGGAAAAAGELAPSYAPELRLKAVVAGAVPADLAAVAKHLDGSLYFAFLGYAVAGLSTSFHIDTSTILNTHGQQVLDGLEHQCQVESLLTYAGTRSSTLTRDGRALTAYLDEAPFRDVVADQLIGNGRRPAVPTLVTHSLLDDVIPYAVGRALAKRWCGQGAPVYFATNVAPTHVGGAFASYPQSFAFLEARFAGLPMVSNCWAL